MKKKKNMLEKSMALELNKGVNWTLTQQVITKCLLCV